MALGLSWLLAAEAPANRLQAVPDGTSRHKRARRQTATTEKMSGGSRFFASGDYCSRTVHRSGRGFDDVDDDDDDFRRGFPRSCVASVVVSEAGVYIRADAYNIRHERNNTWIRVFSFSVA